MKIQTKWFGEIDTTEDKIITFEKGIIGFEDFKKFTIVVDAEKESENTIMWLQSAEEPSLALPIIKPEIVKEDYDPIVEDELIKSLGEDIENAYLAVYVTITVPSDLTKMTCNLKAPIIVNMDTMKGTQLIAGNEDYQVRFPIYDIPDAKKVIHGIKFEVKYNKITVNGFNKRAKTFFVKDTDSTLSRKKDEAVIINDDIEITIIEIKGDQVKIGISAPKSVPIYRKEVYMQIQNANKEAAQSVDIKNIKELFTKK